eukprot:s1971_g12.t2
MYADKKSVKGSGSVITATSRVRDRAWAQAQRKVPESAGTTAVHGIHGAHGTTASDAATGATGALPSQRSDRELLNRGKKLLAKLEKEKLDALAFRAEKPLK